MQSEYEQARAARDRAADGSPVLDIDGPMLVFGGCYSNLEATLALRAEADRLGIPSSRIVCTGDVVAYGADAAATVSVIRDWGIHVAMGNCEESLGESKDECGCGYDEGSACDRLAAQWYSHATRQIGAEERAWMRALPRSIRLRLEGRNVTAVHGAVDLINRFVFASTPWAEKARQIGLAGTDGVVAGHCGLPFTQVAGGQLWHNAGAIGMPANDGTPRGWFSVLAPSRDGVEVRIQPLSYDWHAAARKMRDAGLPEGYAEALQTGLWPSCDILPPEELDARGVAIRPIRQVW